MKVTKIAGMFAVAAVVGLTFGAATNAHATLTLTTSNAAFHDTGSSDLSDSQIATDLGISLSALGTDQFNTDGKTGSFYNDYSLSPNVSQALPITISYVGPNAMAATYIYVKDGSSGSYLFNLGSTGTGALDWNGTDSIYITDLFGKGSGDLSHIEIFEGQGQSIPEPSTIFTASLLLIPFGISAMRVLRKSNQA